jgi:hypothetical protein
VSESKKHSSLFSWSISDEEKKLCIIDTCSLSNEKLGLFLFPDLDFNPQGWIASLDLTNPIKSSN